jgi:hypothetical protein
MDAGIVSFRAQPRRIRSPFRPAFECSIIRLKLGGWLARFGHRHHTVSHVSCVSTLSYPDQLETGCGEDHRH